MTQPPPLPAFNPYAAPSARVEDSPVYQLELAERLVRLAAVILDVLVFVVPVLLMVIPVALIAATAGKSKFGSDFATGGVAIVAIVAVLAMLALFIINMVLLHRYGQTLGKRWLRIKVVRVDGSRCGLSRYIFARWLPVALLGAIPLIGWIFSLIDPLLIFGNEQRCLHDQIAGTIVIKARA